MILSRYGNSIIVSDRVPACTFVPQTTGERARTLSGLSGNSRLSIPTLKPIPVAYVYVTVRNGTYLHSIVIGDRYQRERGATTTTIDINGKDIDSKYSNDKNSNDKRYQRERWLNEY